ncbi:MAG: HI0074 family nucleotidyltransferase substrate-binding subunit [Patescibacteria group bacterium]
MEIFDSFKKSLERFQEILKEEKTVANRDSAIQRFEFTVELAWKSIQQFLRNQKIVCRSPKECLQESFKFGLVEDNPLWIKMIDDRNLTSHTYNEELADKIYNNFPQYFNLLEDLKNSIESKASL